jgi:hypothetical protein
VHESRAIGMPAEMRKNDILKEGCVQVDRIFRVSAISHHSLKHGIKVAFPQEFVLTSVDDAIAALSLAYENDNDQDTCRFSASGSSSTPIDRINRLSDK